MSRLLPRLNLPPRLLATATMALAIGLPALAPQPRSAATTTATRHEQARAALLAESAVRQAEWIGPELLEVTLRGRVSADYAAWFSCLTFRRMGLTSVTIRAKVLAADGGPAQTADRACASTSGESNRT